MQYDSAGSCFRYNLVGVMLLFSTVLVLQKRLIVTSDFTPDFDFSACCVIDKVAELLVDLRIQLIFCIDDGTSVNLWYY